MINPDPRRVQIWASDLKRGALPPISVESGHPAEASLKFSFVTVPRWTLALYPLLCVGLVGAIPIIIIRLVIARRASGPLPVTLAERKYLLAFRWAAPAGIILAGVLFVAALVYGYFDSLSSDPVPSYIGLAGLFLLFAAVVYRLAVMPFIGPKARVTEVPGWFDDLVELRGVHPNFTAAVHAMHDQRRQAQAAPPYTYPSVWQ